MTNEEFVRHISDARSSMYHVAKAILKNDEDCADAIGEAVLRAFDKIDTLKQEKYFKTWLTRILLNECYKILNHRHEEVLYEEYMEKSEEKSTDLDASCSCNEPEDFALIFQRPDSFLNNNCCQNSFQDVFLPYTHGINSAEEDFLLHL